MASNDSPIYSTINTTTGDDLLAYYDTYSSVSYNQGPDPYSSNPVLANGGLVGLEQDLDRWTIQSGHSGSEYAKLQYTKKSCGTFHILFQTTRNKQSSEDDCMKMIVNKTQHLKIKMNQI